MTVAGTCGIPATARAAVVNVTAITPAGNGYLAVHPGYLEPTGTSALTFVAGGVRTCLTILPLALNGTGTLTFMPVITGGGTVHVVFDVSGWFE